MLTCLRARVATGEVYDEPNTGRRGAKQLKAAAEGGRIIRAYNMRLALDRLAKGGYVVARPTGIDLVRYRITERGQEALAEHD